MMADSGGEGALLPLFVAPSQLEPFISNELREGPLRPIRYRDGRSATTGYDARIEPALDSRAVSVNNPPVTHPPGAIAQSGRASTVSTASAVEAGAPDDVLVTQRMTSAGLDALYESGRLEGHPLSSDPLLIREVFARMWLARPARRASAARAKAR